jgi:hypothetical protein
LKRRSNPAEKADHRLPRVAPDRLGGGCGCGAVRFEVAGQFVAHAAPWEPIPDDGLARHDERMPRI